jgi:hypothetical protein
MATTLMFWAFLSPVLAATTKDLPIFSWTTCPSVDGAEQPDKCLEVDFPSDRTDDIALLTYVDGISTILKGTLMTESSVSVSVTVEDSILTIILHSTHDQTHAMYQADLAKKTTMALNLPDGVVLDAAPIAPDEINNQTLDGNFLSEREISRRFVPATGFKLRVAVFYDDTFNGMNGGSTSASETKIRSIFNHVTNLFKLLTVNGQSATIVPVISRIVHASGHRWTADASLRTASSISNRLQWDVDAHVFICFQNNMRGVAGIAWVRSTCSKYQYYRTNVNEWISDDANSARIIAHELGHNLGMFHDFNGGNVNSARNEGGQPCTNVGGIMDYRSNPNKWSPCSVGDFTRYYQAVAAARPNDGVRPSSPYCLVAADAATPTTTTAAPTTTPSADAVACVAKCVAEFTTADAPACVKHSACTDACSKGSCTA